MQEESNPMDSRRQADQNRTGMNESPNQYDAVTFDFWNTLASERPNYMHSMRIAGISALLLDSNLTFDEAEIAAAVSRARDAHISAWGEGRQFSSDDASRAVVEDLRIDPESDLGHRMYDAMALTGLAGEIDLEPAPEIHETITALRNRGLKIGIICDVGLTPSASLRGFLARVGLLDQFDGWSFSDEVGHYKPAKEIFAHALESLGGVDPVRAAHVGDLRRTDIAGARTAGMTAIRYCGLNDDRSGHPEGDLVVTDHSELLEILG